MSYVSKLFSLAKTTADSAIQKAVCSSVDFAISKFSPLPPKTPTVQKIENIIALFKQGKMAEGHALYYSLKQETKNKTEETLWELMNFPTVKDTLVAEEVMKGNGVQNENGEVIDAATDLKIAALNEAMKTDQPTSSSKTTQLLTSLKTHYLATGIGAISATVAGVATIAATLL